MSIDLNENQSISDKCHIRAAGCGDCERMAALATQLGYPSNVQDIQRRTTEMTDPKCFAVFVAEGCRHEVIGWIGAYIFRSVEMDKYAEISGLVVDESARCQGVGAKLLGAAEERARTTGCARLAVRSNIVRERAHRFYLSHAYQHIKTQNTFSKTFNH